MLIKYCLYLVDILVGIFQRTIDGIVRLTNSLVVVYGRRLAVRLVLEILDGTDRLLMVGSRYLERVGTTLRYRLYFEAVTGPMRERYRQLKRR
jgi:hypothetical protein